jgi:hypothetical protein
VVVLHQLGKRKCFFPMMNIEINATMKEHDRQRNEAKQTLNATVETANKHNGTI